MLRAAYSIFCFLAVLTIAVVLKDFLGVFMQGTGMLLVLPVFGVLLFALSELLYRFTPMRRQSFYMEDYLKKGLWFALYSFFIALCVLGAYAVTGVMLKGWIFIVIGYFVFRFAKLVKPRDAGDYM